MAGAVGAAGAAGSARRRDGRIAQERMLEEAMAAIAEGGLAELTMSALAERLGTSGGHILYYFGSKDRLLLAALRWSEDRLAAERAQLLARRVTAHRKLALFLELYLPRGPAIRAGPCGSSCGPAPPPTRTCAPPSRRSTTAGSGTWRPCSPRAWTRAASPQPWTCPPAPRSCSHYWTD